MGRNPAKPLSAKIHHTAVESVIIKRFLYAFTRQRLWNYVCFPCLLVSRNIKERGRHLYLLWFILDAVQLAIKIGHLKMKTLNTMKHHTDKQSVTVSSICTTYNNHNTYRKDYCSCWHGITIEKHAKRGGEREMAQDCNATLERMAFKMTPACIHFSDPQIS